MIDVVLDRINKFVPEKWRWILSHEGFRRYFKNTSWMFFGQIISLAASFFIGAWLARYLGPNNYGVLNYALSFGGLLGFLSYLVADNILSRELIKYPEKKDSLLGTALVLKLIGGFVSLVLTFIAAFIFESNYLTRSLILIYSFSFLLPAFGIVGTFFQANVQAKKTVKAQMVSMIISSALKVGIILSGLGVIWVMLVYVLDGAWSSVTLWLVYKQNGFNIRKWYFDKSLAISLFRDSVYLLLSSAIWFVYIKIDQIIIGKLMGNSDVGLYAAAVKISEIWNFIPGIICASLFPAIINAKIKGREIYRHRLKNLYWFLGSLAVVLALPITLLAKPIILFLFGPDYQAAAPILQIYIWSSVGMFLNAGVNQYMIAENMMRTTLILSLLGTAANIALNLILIPAAGLNGAALASFFSYFLIPIFVLFFGEIFRKKIG